MHGFALIRHEIDPENLHPFLNQSNVQRNPMTNSSPVIYVIFLVFNLIFYWLLRVLSSDWSLTFNPPDLISNSPYCLPYSSWDVSLENLGSDQLIIP